MVAIGLLTAILSLLFGEGMFQLGKRSCRGAEINRPERTTQKPAVPEMRQDVFEEIREFREQTRVDMQEMRRNHEQLLLALTSHGHDETGQAAFRSPL